jgi:hypothetical protein
MRHTCLAGCVLERAALPSRNHFCRRVRGRLHVPLALCSTRLPSRYILPAGLHCSLCVRGRYKLPRRLVAILWIWLVRRQVILPRGRVSRKFPIHSVLCHESANSLDLGAARIRLEFTDWSVAKH